MTSKKPGTWGGSEFTAFVMASGYVTPMHVDVYEANGCTVYPPSAGIMRAVNRRYTGPAKKALVVCDADVKTVVEKLGLDRSQRAFRQYSGPLKTLKDVASVLRETGVRYVSMEFPAECSYILPGGCPHMFETLGLIESVVWHPSLSL